MIDTNQVLRGFDCLLCVIDTDLLTDFKTVSEKLKFPSLTGVFFNENPVHLQLGTQMRQLN